PFQVDAWTRRWASLSGWKARLLLFLTIPVVISNCWHGFEREGISRGLPLVARCFFLSRISSKVSDRKSKTGTLRARPLARCLLLSITALTRSTTEERLVYLGYRSLIDISVGFLDLGSFPRDPRSQRGT